MASRYSRETRPKRRSARRRRTATAAQLVRLVLGVAILAWILRSFIVQPFYIPSASMLPSLYVGDYLIVAKWPYGYSAGSFPLRFPSFEGRLLGHLPRRGDVVVFRHPTERADLIKRVIGLPGDTVELRDGKLILNDRPVPRRAIGHSDVPLTPNSPCRVPPDAAAKLATVGGRPACSYRAFSESLPGGPNYTVLDQVHDGPADNFPRTRVPTGRLFVMGDNRDDSLDSRFPPSEGGVGMLPADRLVGRAWFTFWSTDGSASYLKPWSWVSALRARRLGQRYTGSAL